MKKVLFLGRDETRSGFETPELFQAVMPEYLGSDFEIYNTRYSDLLYDVQPGRITITDTANDKDLTEFDFVLVFGWTLRWREEALAAAEYLQRHNVAFINSEAIYQTSSGKLSQAVFFGFNNLPIPKTIYMAKPGAAQIAYIIEALGLPLVYKQMDGKKGELNFLVRSKEELIKIIKNHPEESIRFIAQEYIPSDGDLRVICGNGKIRMIIARKSADGSHLHNTSQGAAATEVALDILSAEDRAACLKASELMHRELTGVDLIQDTKSGKYFILECNNFPQMISGALPDRKATIMAEIIKDKLKGIDNIT